MKPEVKRILTKLAENNKDSVKVELSKSKLNTLFNESIDMYASAKVDAQKIEKEFQTINRQNQKIKDKLTQNRKEAFRLASDLVAAYKVIGEDPPSWIDKWTDGISDVAAKVPVSNLANMFAI